MKRLAATLWALTATCADAQATDAPPQFRDWQLVCQSDRATCAVAQRLVAPNGGLFLADVQVMGTADGYVLVLTTPLGPFLPERPAAQVGGRAPLAFDWHSCDGHTCRAVHRLDDATLTAMKRGSRMTLAYRLAGSREARRIEVSLMGLTAALRALDARADFTP